MRRPGPDLISGFRAGKRRRARGHGPKTSHDALSSWALIHLPNDVLKLYCADMLAGRSHINGWVYQTFNTYYSVAELEAKQLWQRMDTKIASLGGCGKF